MLPGVIGEECLRRHPGLGVNSDCHLLDLLPQLDPSITLRLSFPISKIEILNIYSAKSCCGNKGKMNTKSLPTAVFIVKLSNQLES